MSRGSSLKMYKVAKKNTILPSLRNPTSFKSASTSFSSDDRQSRQSSSGVPSRKGKERADDHSGDLRELLYLFTFTILIVPDLRISPQSRRCPASFPLLAFAAFPRSLPPQTAYTSGGNIENSSPRKRPVPGKRRCAAGDIIWYAQTAWE